MSKSSIEWTEETWNPTTGCDKISAGCKHCYAEVMAKRLKAMGQHKYRNGFELTIHPNTLKLPYTWKKPRTVFVNSMSDLFHEKVSLEYLQQIFQVMNDCVHHTFQILTKRSDRLIKFSQYLNWSTNIWMGVSIENSDVLYRVEDLKQCNATTKFLSLEPLLGPLSNLNLKGLQWVIVGGESGMKARDVAQEWVTDIRDQCLDSRVPFFFKQWGGINKKKAGRMLEGRTWDETPYSHNHNMADLLFENTK